MKNALTKLGLRSPAELAALLRPAEPSANDGDVTALAGALGLKDDSVLGTFSQDAAIRLAKVACIELSADASPGEKLKALQKLLAGGDARAASSRAWAFTWATTVVRDSRDPDGSAKRFSRNSPAAEPTSGHARPRPKQRQ